MSSKYQILRAFRHDPTTPQRLAQRNDQFTDGASPPGILSCLSDRGTHAR